MIRISDLEFEIAKARFYGELTSKDLTWALLIKGVPKYAGREEWEPMIGSDDLFGLHGKPLKKWSDILKYSLSWSEWFDEERDRPNAIIYVFEHVGVYDSVLTFGERRGTTFSIEWNAKCDVFFNERYYDNLNLNIEADVVFQGIFIDEENMCKESAVAALSGFLDPNDFEYCEEHPEELRPCFRPLPDS